MPISGEYVPSQSVWVADQVAEYEASGGQRANTLMDTGIPIIIVTMIGASSGKVRKIGLMRVQHDGEYALVASKGGDPDHPAWYANLLADPSIMIQDGAEPHDFMVHEVFGAVRDTWWERAAAVYPPYLDYQEKTDRIIPVLVAVPA